MNPKEFRALMYNLLSQAMERDKQAHLTSINELAALCPKAEKDLHDLHTRYCQRLDSELEEARVLIDDPFVDECGGVDEPVGSLLTYLAGEPLYDQPTDVQTVIRRTFGQPVSG